MTDLEWEQLLAKAAEVTERGQAADVWQTGLARIDGQAYPCYAKGKDALRVAAYGRRPDGSVVLACAEGRPIKPELQKELGGREPGTVWTCQYEHSCGALLIVKGERPARYLVIEGNSGHIGFPKGHIEQGERIADTVTRELREEVGIIDFRYIEGFRVDSEVLTRKNRNKTVTYFLAEFDPSRNVLHRQEEEIRSIWLLGYAEARERVNTELDRELLDQAEKLLSEIGKA
ncbi:NUDIX domain-containing protein [Butyricicoccus sp. 1XD8-22]|nr:NUDIX domain-containing protein [Butyricicoccus sp. 1XD8-22]